MADETPTTASSPSSPPSSDAQQDGILTIHLTVTGNQGSPRIPLQVAKDVTPTQLRRLAAEATSIPLAALRLIFGGRMIQDSDGQSAASVLKLEDGCVLHCIGKPSAATPAPSTTGIDAAGTSNAAAAVSVTGSLATATAAAAATSASPASSSAVATSSVATALQELRRGNSETSYKTAVSTLDKVLSNIVEHPMEEKYRNLKANNPAFQRRFGALSGAEAVMIACGFARQDQPANADGGGEGAGEPYYVLQASADNWPRLLETHASVKALAARVSSGGGAAPASGIAAASNQPSPSLPWGGGAAPLPGSGPAGMGGLPPFAQSQAVQSLMSDPANLQRMLQVRSITLWRRTAMLVGERPTHTQILTSLFFCVSTPPPFFRIPWSKP
jgi:PUB domain/Ubiquitin family